MREAGYAVLSGASYLDMDAWAGCLAQAELLRRLGHAAMAVSSARPNASVPSPLRGDRFAAAYPAGAASVLVDVSDPAFFDPLCAGQPVGAVIDHHPGWVAHWDSMRGVTVRIEAVGAAATLVWEGWREACLTPPLPLARLLGAAILDNTLNFRSTMTTDRDRTAYDRLLADSRLEPDFGDCYAAWCMEEQTAGLSSCLRLDSKEMRFADFPQVYGQLLMWREVSGYGQRVQTAMAALNPGSSWLVGLLDLQCGHTRFLCSSRDAARQVSALLGGKADGAVYLHPALVLRKEVLSLLLAREQKAQGKKQRRRCLP